MRTPDYPIETDIRELARREEVDAREAWQKAREARFAEQIYDDLHVLDDAVALLADKSKAAATARKYKLHWARFVKFAAENVLDDGYRHASLAGLRRTCCVFSVERVDARPVVFVGQAGCGGDQRCSHHQPFADPTQSLVCRAAVRLLGNMTANFRRPS